VRLRLRLEVEDLIIGGGGSCAGSGLVSVKDVPLNESGPTSPSLSQLGTTEKMIPSSPRPNWPQKLRKLHADLISNPDAADAGSIRGELWVILNAAMRRYLRLHARRMTRLGRADLEDLASEKSLDLLRGLASGVWGLVGRTDDEIAGYLWQAARNGIIDFLRRPESRRRAEGMDPERAREAAVRGSAVEAAPPDAQAETRGFINALTDCAGRLEPRSRRIWLFRVFHGLSTREISVHPEVALAPGGVDMLLHRTRRRIRECMERKGHRVHELPAGTFAALWMTLHHAGEQRPMANHDQTTDILVS
jgi:RNA polymerase sigma factor (sigma-70 family)